MLTGRTASAAPGLVSYDAWEIAGDGTPGHAWSNRNPLAAVALYPDRRYGAWPALPMLQVVISRQDISVTMRIDITTFCLFPGGLDAWPWRAEHVTA